MVTLPSLAHLYLGVPTAGKESKRRVAKAANPPPPPPPAENTPATGHSRISKSVQKAMNAVIQEYKKEAKKMFGMDVLRGGGALWFLTAVLDLFWNNLIARGLGFDYTRVNPKENPNSDLQLAHLELYELQRATGVVEAGQPNARKATVTLNLYLRAIAFDIFNNYVRKESPDGPARSEEKIEEIINKPDVELLESVFIRRRATFEPEKTKEVLRHMLAYYRKVIEWMNELQEQNQNAPRPPREKPKKGTAEYERNVQANKDREAQEEKKRLAKKQADDEKSARARAERKRDESNKVKEREDQVAQQQQSTNLAGSSDDHAQQESLSPGSEARASMKAQEKEEAKQKDIAESNARREEQQAEKDRIAAAEADRQAERAAKRETGERIQTGR